MLQIQSKRFYLDVKQNLRGRFIKVAEVSTSRDQISNFNEKSTKKKQINSHRCSIWNVNFMQYHVIQYTHSHTDWSRWKAQSNIFSIIYCCRISWSSIDIQWFLLVLGYVKLTHRSTLLSRDQQHLIKFNWPIFLHCNSICVFTGPPNPENVPEDGKLKSEMMIKDNRRYYLDLKENTRGRFLRVCSRTVFTCDGHFSNWITFCLGISNHNTWRATITNRYSSSRYDWVSWCVNRFVRRIRNQWWRVSDASMDALNWLAR